MTLLFCHISFLVFLIAAQVHISFIWNLFMTYQIVKKKEQKMHMECYIDQNEIF